MNTTWVRGVVKARRSDDNFLVSLSDIGAEMCVPAHKIKCLPSFLRAVPPLAIPCFLTDLSPLPGEETWSEMAVDEMKKLINPQGSK